MSLHDKLKFNKRNLKQTISDKNRNFLIFKKWLDEGGAQYPSLYFKKYSDTERGVHTKINLKAGKEIIYIPKNLLILSDMPSEYGRLIGSKINSIANPRLIQLALYILSTIQDPESYFTPYYDILPDDLGHLPIFWNKSRMDLLEGSDIIRDINARRGALSNEYDQLCKICENVSYL